MHEEWLLRFHFCATRSQSSFCLLLLTNSLVSQKRSTWERFGTGASKPLFSKFSFFLFLNHYHISSSLSEGFWIPPSPLNPHSRQTLAKWSPRALSPYGYFVTQSCSSNSRCEEFHERLVCTEPTYRNDSCFRHYNKGFVLRVYSVVSD